MSLISLKNVSKFYYSKGVIASGFSRVNLDLNDGEFVAITGESGSGKSTLLNVISGLDSYEEGEMYINGEETSHYTEKDFEDYRRKYIGNIFQSFNLVNSYTVYQNIELVLLLNGNKKKNIKNNVLELIKKVGLTKFKNTKVSKLSGGQKQRVAIARALAKETPIIIADEPTGNLDSKSANEVLKLLSEIASDKLVVVVTHNYDQIEKYVTRKITMSDGRIIEDKTIKKIDKKEDIKTSNYQNITPLNRLRIGIRNAFNIKVKFLLLLFVYFFILFAISVEYASFKDEEAVVNKSGVNDYLHNTSEKRVILTKKDKSIFTEDDYNKLAKLDNIETVFKNDQVLDGYIDLNNGDDIYLYGMTKPISLFKGRLDKGRMPENENEIIAVPSNYDYSLSSDYLLDKDIYLSSISSANVKNKKAYKIVGIKYKNSDDFSDMGEFYISDELSKKIYADEVYYNSKTKVNFYNKTITIEGYGEYSLVSNPNVKDGTIVLSDYYNSYCKYQNCRNKVVNITTKNLFYEDSIDLKITNVFTNKNNFSRYTGIKSSEYYDGKTEIYISENDFNHLFAHDYYQASVFVKNMKHFDDTITLLKESGYSTFAVKDALYVHDSIQIIQIVKTIVMVILVIVLFIISYFVTRVIVKSRKVYFSTIRILGSTKKICKKLLTIELLVISNIAYLVFFIVCVLTKLNYIKMHAFKNILYYLNISDYILLYFIINIMSLIISIKYAKKIFTKSAVSTLKEDN